MKEWQDKQGFLIVQELGTFWILFEFLYQPMKLVLTNERDCEVFVIIHGEFLMFLLKLLW